MVIAVLPHKTITVKIKINNRRKKNMRTECANKWKQRTFLHTWKKCKRKEIPQIAITVYAQLVATTIFHFESDPELAIQSKSNQIFKTETITTISMIQEKKIGWYRKSVEVVTMNDNQSVCSHIILFLFQSLVFQSRQRWFLQKQMMVLVFRRLKWQCIFPFALVSLLFRSCFPLVVMICIICRICSCWKDIIYVWMLCQEKMLLG